MADNQNQATCFVRAAANQFGEDGLLYGTATTGLINRYEEELPGSAVDFQAYLKNPVVTWAHKWDEPPIAKVVKLWNQIDVAQELDSLKFALEFATHDKAQIIRQLYQGGFLNAFSMGFLMHAIEPVKRAGRTIRRVTRAEMLELAAVSVPADPGALQDGPVFRSYSALVADCLGLGGEEVLERGASGRDLRPRFDPSLTKRLDHLVHELMTGRPDNPTDLAMLREVAFNALLLHPAEGDDMTKLTLAKTLVQAVTDAGDQWLLELDNLVGSRLPSHVTQDQALAQMVERVRELGKMAHRQS